MIHAHDTYILARLTERAGEEVCACNVQCVELARGPQPACTRILSLTLAQPLRKMLEGCLSMRCVWDGV